MAGTALARATPRILGEFFVAAVTLFWPGTFVDAIWQAKPDEYRMLAALGWAGRRRWGSCGSAWCAHPGQRHSRKAGSGHGRRLAHVSPSAIEAKGE